MHPYHQRRNSADRLAAITEYIGNTPGIKVLEFGALDGWFSQQLTEKLAADCTVVDDNPNLSGANVINKRLTATDIRKLGSFDVVLALSVLHHVPQWKSTLNALLNAAPVVFIETAHPDETLPKAVNHSASAQIVKAVEDAGAISITQTPGYDSRFTRDLWVIDRRTPAVASADAETD